MCFPSLITHHSKLVGPTHATLVWMSFHYPKLTKLSYELVKMKTKKWCFWVMKTELWWHFCNFTQLMGPMFCVLSNQCPPDFPPLSSLIIPDFFFFSLFFDFLCPSSSPRCCLLLLLLLLFFSFSHWVSRFGFFFFFFFPILFH